MLRPYFCIKISLTGNVNLMLIIKNSKQLGDAVRQARKLIGLTQPKLALASGVGVRFIVELEAGKPTVQLERVLRVVDSLGLDLQLGGFDEIASDPLDRSSRIRKDGMSKRRVGSNSRGR